MKDFFIVKLSVSMSAPFAFHRFVRICKFAIKSVCHSCLTIGSECPAATNIVLRGARLEGAGNLLNLKVRPDTPQRYSDIIVEGCSGSCRTFFSMKPWKQFFDPKGRAPADLMSHVCRVVMRGNTIQCRNPRVVKWDRKVFDVADIDIDDNVINGKGNRKDLLWNPVAGTKNE